MHIRVRAVQHTWADGNGHIISSRVTDWTCRASQCALRGRGLIRIYSEDARAGKVQAAAGLHWDDTAAFAVVLVVALEYRIVALSTHVSFEVCDGLAIFIDDCNWQRRHRAQRRLAVGRFAGVPVQCTKMAG